MLWIGYLIRKFGMRPPTGIKSRILKSNSQMSHLPKFSFIITPALLAGMAGHWLIVAGGTTSLSADHRLGHGLGRLSMHFCAEGYVLRSAILSSAFLSPAQRHEMLIKNFESLGMGLMETGMAWFWPTHRVERWTETSGVNEVVELQEQKQGILLIGIHFLTRNSARGCLACSRRGLAFTGQTIIR